jgi:hypothetical protein
MWMAGGGIKGGTAYGKTDEFGYYPVESPVTIRDIQATILNAMGLDPYRFSYLYQGLNNRPAKLSACCMTVSMRLSNRMQRQPEKSVNAMNMLTI